MSSNSDILDCLNPAAVSSTSRGSNTSVRSRNRGLISVNDDGEGEGTQVSSTSRLGSSFTGLSPSRSRGTTPSPYASRGGSPLPQKQFSRISERDLSGGYRSDEDTCGSRDTFQPFNTSNNPSGFLESSWSSIQNLTSSLLGSDLKWGKSSSNSTASMKRRKPSRSDIPVSLSKQQGLSSWAPPTRSTPQIGVGTQEERQALVQAKKREVLLLVNGDSLSEMRGWYKRKDSDGSIMDPERDEEALVYIHHVQPSDTMTGLCIKYGCQLAIFRKANGFWPSDSIQTRKVVLLPAEACSVKGRRVNRGSNVDFLGDDLSGESSLEDPAGSSIMPSESPTTSTQPEISQTNDSDNERIWKHETWVEMEGFPSPVEMGRVPRKTLGFFPRSRRKSLSLPYSDVEPPTPTIPTALNRMDSSSSSQAYQRDSSSNTHSPLRNGRPAHRRTGSITLQGPGGVGTLGREVHAPGPAQDGLNKFVSQHLPNLTVPPPPPPSTLRKASFDSTSSVLSGTSSTGLENVGGAIEGWMRKMALRAKSTLNELQQGGPHQTSSQGQALGIAGLGDLIELDDGFEGGIASEAAISSMGNGHTESHSGRNRTMGNYSQYERFSNSPSSRNRTRLRIDDAHKND
ncbi:LysM domain protein, putative [Talaromyces stipitatus ATCC 10500]|uniref:LysM domain protein, putative n=1 Tax=Talaromyces stipitatus (strain ATCC 10500 / CBS 375.48 / QM 6759 / NRRL 1006) TaxID=441959 RepID=B8MDQ5_TALSN|nr:LysM domain protein, putative [Talaromyces stipitatus ATCC 10500]EED18284.1 LysM domain protein, putative [Talaromyces stipitatus ATCC 10500]